MTTSSATDLGCHSDPPRGLVAEVRPSLREALAVRAERPGALQAGLGRVGIDSQRLRGALVGGQLKLRQNADQARCAPARPRVATVAGEDRLERLAGRALGVGLAQQAIERRQL